jgi:hypothetical protein
VQSLASVCKTKCSVLEISGSDKKENHKTEQPDCHSKQDADSESNDDECGSICQADDIIKSDADSFSLSDTLIKIEIYSRQSVENILDHELAFSINTHDPPGSGFYRGPSIYIQKSSFLI